MPAKTTKKQSRSRMLQYGRAPREKYHLAKSLIDFMIVFVFKIGIVLLAYFVRVCKNG